MTHFLCVAVLTATSGFPWTMRFCTIAGDEHGAVHNVRLARLVFILEDDCGLYRCAIETIEVGKGVAI